MILQFRHYKAHTGMEKAWVLLCFLLSLISKKNPNQIPEWFGYFWKMKWEIIICSHRGKTVTRIPLLSMLLLLVWIRLCWENSSRPPPPFLHGFSSFPLQSSQNNHPLRACMSEYWAFPPGTSKDHLLMGFLHRHFVGSQSVQLSFSLPKALMRQEQNTRMHCCVEGYDDFPAFKAIKKKKQAQRKKRDKLHYARPKICIICISLKWVFWSLNTWHFANSTGHWRVKIPRPFSRILNLSGLKEIKSKPLPFR